MITVTDLCDYTWCPYQVYLKKVKKIRPPPTKKMVKGTIMHKIMEIVPSHQEILVRNSIGDEESFQIIQSRLEKSAYQCAKNIVLKEKDILIKSDIDMIDFLSDIKKDIRYDSIILAAKIMKLMRLYDMDTVADILFPSGRREHPLEDGSLGLRGRIDKVEKNGPFAIPIDYKTGVPVSEPHDSYKMQLCAYALLLERVENMQVPMGIIEFTSTGKTIPIPCDDISKKWVLDTIDAVKAIINKEVVPAKNKGKKCKMCSFNEHCI